jgi:hypothetical protein
MYDSKKAHINDLRIQFDREVEEQARTARDTGREYMNALTDFLQIFDEGAGADMRLRDIDTTGELGRLEGQAEWAEEERLRVRRTLDGLV